MRTISSPSTEDNWEVIVIKIVRFHSTSYLVNSFPQFQKVGWRHFHSYYNLCLVPIGYNGLNEQSNSALSSADPSLPRDAAVIPRDTFSYLQLFGSIILTHSFTVFST